MTLGKNATAKVVAMVGSVVALVATWILVHGNPPPSPADAASAAATPATASEQPAAPARPARATQRVPLVAPPRRTRTRAS